MQLRIGQIGNARISNSMYVQYSTSKYRGTAAYSISVLAWYGVQLYYVVLCTCTPTRALAGGGAVYGEYVRAYSCTVWPGRPLRPRPPEAQNSELLCVPR